MAEDTTEKGNQLIDDIKETTKNRLSNPVFFSYLFSWIVCNWTFISFMMFSNKTIEYKLSHYGKYIDFFGWLYPIIGVLIYLIGLNYVDNGLFRISKHGYQKKMDSWRERVNMKTHAEVEIARKKVELQKEQIEASKLETLITERDRLIHLVNSRDSEIKELNDKILQLQGRMDSMKRVSFSDSDNPSLFFRDEAMEVIRILEMTSSTSKFIEIAQGLKDGILNTTYTQIVADSITFFEKLGLVSGEYLPMSLDFPQLTVLGYNVLDTLKAGDSSSSFIL